jgi:hypothetical protein
MLIGTNVALQVLQARLLVIMSMLMTFGLFCWSMWLESQLAIVIAAAFAVLVFLPILWSAGERHATTQHHASDSSRVPARTATGEPRRRAGGNSMEERDHARAAESQAELDV